MERGERRGPASGGRADGAGGGAAAVLIALVAPLRFATRERFAGLPRLVGFGATLRDAVRMARDAGAPDSAALAGLAAEADAFERLDLAGRRAALTRIVGHLASLVPVPDELRAIARAASASHPPTPPGASPAPGPAPSPPPTPAAPRNDDEGVDLAVEERPVAMPPEPQSPAERAERRRKLATPLAQVPRAHPAPRAQLEERGMATVQDALEFLPKGWQDRTRAQRIADVRLGEEAIVVGTVRHVRTQRMRNGRPILKVGLGDASGVLELVFFNAPPWRQKELKAGDTLLASGKVTEGFGGRRQLTQPEIEKLAAGDSANFGRIVPVYPGPADWQHPSLRRLMKRLCDEYAPWIVDELPAAVRARRALVSRAEALRQVHFPAPGTDLALSAERASPAFRRLVFEELFFLQLALARRRQGVRGEPGIAFDATPEALAEAIRPLPFALTGAQRRVLGEIAGDMARPEPMSRLLQGDVGSGKTAVAFAAMMLAVRSGWQAALMVPTEILAEQHARTFARWLDGSGVEAVFVGAQARGRGQRDARASLAEGRARIAIGTHALLEEGVAFERLGLVVVDEQHRFGVEQRAALARKGRRPDVLVMTATPIPRTLALAFYGDLDQSKVDELPPGRTPVSTRLFGDSQRKAAYALAREELEAGRQVFVVYPLVAESEKSDLADATSGAEALRRVFAGHEVGLLHGQLKGEEKQAVMERFRAGGIRVLVATTVIEVGVDVPNATVMIVEHAERFGLSQLHQLRGRVGRGADRSHCLLLAHFKRAGDDARERLEAMVRTQDGFEIARVDLKLRGPGELLGTRQAGQRLLEVADLYRDEKILEEARSEAFALVEADPHLARPENAAAREALEERWAGRLSLAQVG
ncbi:MAG TPA: ATP-dependent DNA helicase RecG [Anaeromyxobacteraceae bacterium]|nr:ATP-dependent DNA helicase RecG [Anaeromyxobacteraceae bacterium]